MRLHGFQWVQMGPYISSFVPMESNGFCWGFIGHYASLWILNCFMGTYASMWTLMGPNKNAIDSIRTHKNT